jgi:hypothetical protein
MNFVGKTVVMRYESGLEVKGYYPSTEELRWQALTGPSQGSEGVERIYSSEIAPNIYFINWLEAGGTTVSQILDMNRSAVTAFVTFDAGDSRQAVFDSGLVTELADEQS